MEDHLKAEVQLMQVFVVRGRTDLHRGTATSQYEWGEVLVGALLLVEVEELLEALAHQMMGVQMKNPRGQKIVLVSRPEKAE